MHAMFSFIEQAFSDPSTLFFLSLIFITVSTLLITKRSSKSLRNPPPSPPKLPFIGNLHQLGTLAHRSLQTLAKKHGPLMLLHFGERPALIVTSPRMAHAVLKTHDAIFANRPLNKVTGILTYDHQDMAFAPYGEQWRCLRKIASTHLLSAKRVVQSFKNLREEEVLVLLKNIKRAAENGKSVDLTDLISTFTFDLIGHMVFGKSFRKKGRNDKLKTILVASIPVIGKFNLEDFFPSLSWLGSILGGEVREEAKRIARDADELITELLEEHVEGDEEDYVDVLRKLQKDENQRKEFVITDVNLKSTLLEALAAGTEPLAISLEWNLVELLRNPKTMKKLQDEVRGVLPQNKMLTSEDVSKMSYLTAIITETFRLHPPTPLLLPRESMEYCQIEGYDIPKGSRVFVNTFAIGRDPEIWDNPEEFRPERFINNPYNYIGNNCEIFPFGGGRRICPGLQIANLALELALANLVRRFDWELPNGQKSEEIDMTEAPSLSLKRKEKLDLVAKPWIVES
ncbi:hypothetical protein LUZ60_013706 [Juncus effusus]|nr:hypothetical protein LUZ60_013706 [Juncus effusus]